jgi:hypothetical protein
MLDLFSVDAFRGHFSDASSRHVMSSFVALRDAFADLSLFDMLRSVDASSKHPVNMWRSSLRGSLANHGVGWIVP